MVLSVGASLWAQRTEFVVDDSLGIALAVASPGDGAFAGALTSEGELLSFDTLHALGARGRFTAVTAGGDTLTAYVSELPVIELWPADSIVDEPKRPVRVVVRERGRPARSFDAAVELRGASSLTFPKKTYDLELRAGPNTDESRKESLCGLREDDDWVLDALYNEPLRVRSVMAHELWTDQHRLYYQDRAPEARAGARAVHCEVFVGGRYRGVYALSEQVDRNQLGLRKPDDHGRARGTLVKSITYTPSTMFEAYASPPSDDSAHYDGYDWEYPRHEPSWGDFAEVLAGVTSPLDARYPSRALPYFDEANLADYYVFLQVTNLLDNSAKNIYFGRYDAGEPLFMTPWDLDASFGNTPTGTTPRNTRRVLDFPLARRLDSAGHYGFAEQCARRYRELRDGAWAGDALWARFDSIATHLEDNHAYERESLLWPVRVSSQRSYLRSWVTRRLQFLDQHFAAELDRTTTTSSPYLADDVYRVYPNPTRSTLQVDRPSGENPAVLRLLDVRGATVLRAPTTGATTRLEVGGIPPGTYLLSDGARATRVVIGR